MQKLIFIVLIALCTTNISCTKNLESIKNIPQTKLFSFQNIEEQPLQTQSRYIDPISQLEYTGWGVYEDIIFPETTILWEMKPALFDSKKTLSLAIKGGDAYNNVFFTNTVAMAWEQKEWPYKNTNKLVYHIKFYLPDAFNCSNPNASKLEGLEFTFQHLLIPNSFGYGLQYSKSGEWRYWNDEKDPKTEIALAWQSFSPKLTTCLSNHHWYELTIEGTLVNQGVRYTKMILDGTEFNLGNAQTQSVSSPEGWVENFLQVGVQLNGNTATESVHEQGVDPVQIYIDELSLEGYNVP